MFKKFRYSFVKFVIRRIFKIPEGKLLPKYLIFFKFCFFPITHFVCKFYNDIYNFSGDTYTINGIKFSSQFFEIDKVGKKFEVIQLTNGIITIKDI